MRPSGSLDEFGTTATGFAFQLQRKFASNFHIEFRNDDSGGNTRDGVQSSEDGSTLEQVYMALLSDSAGKP
jgi:hypothetical protein